MGGGVLTTVDQSLIRVLVNAVPIYVSGACLELNTCVDIMSAPAITEHCPTLSPPSITTRNKVSQSDGGLSFLHLFLLHYIGNSPHKPKKFSCNTNNRHIGFLTFGKQSFVFFAQSCLSFPRYISNSFRLTF